MSGMIPCIETPIYNCKPQKRSEHPYQFIHTDLVGPISPTGFSGERYFFTFTDDCTRHTETYTGAKKSDWLHCLKSFHNLAKTRTKIERPTERIRSDYCSELQSKKAEQWLSLEGIILEPSAPYLQEENGVAERLGRTLMDMARATIIEGNIDDCFGSEVILAMTHIKNLQPTSSLKGLSPHEELLHDLPDLSHLRILGSTVYVLIHEQERERKSENFVPRALKGQLVGFDGHTIYPVHIEMQKRVIRVKDLQIFEDTITKPHTILPSYDGEPSFQGFLVEDNDDIEVEPNITLDTDRPIAPKASGTDRPTAPKSKRPKDAGFEKAKEPSQKRSRSGRETKPTEKAKNQELVAYLSTILDRDWESKANVLLTSLDKVEEEEEEDPYKILALKLLKENAKDTSQFAYATHLDVEESESYNRAMQCPHAAQWSRAMEEELVSLHENKTWVLIPKEEMESGHRPLGGK